MPLPSQTTCTVLLLLGDSGAGKSSFINALAGDGTAAVNTGLEPCTSEVSSYPIQRAKGNVLLVDTPGLNRPKKDTDSMIEKIAELLGKLDSSHVFGKALLFVPLNVARQGAMAGFQKPTSTIWSDLLSQKRISVVAVVGHDTKSDRVQERQETLQKAQKESNWDESTLIKNKFDFKAESAASILDEVLKNQTENSDLDLKAVKEMLGRSEHGKRGQRMAARLTRLPCVN